LQRSQQLWVYLYGITHHLNIAEIIWVKNLRAIVVCGFLMK
jgi:hypothetical protein